MQKDHNYTIDFLRGLASLFVVLFHFTNGQPGYLPDGNIFKKIGSFGNLGVDIFFVISGYIIPYSMNRSGYKTSNFKVFLLRRLIRIEPPYVITIVLVLFLNYVSTLSPYYHGDPYILDNNSILTIMSHLGYLTQIVGYSWLNPVFWTLGIEFQFYLFISFYFVFLTNNNKWIKTMSLIIIFTLSILIKDGSFVFHYLLLFLPGIICFLYQSKKLSPLYFYAILGINIFYGYFIYSLPTVLALIFSVVFINHVKLGPNRLFNFLGKISFSLYLIHVPIGMRIINFSQNLIYDSSIRLLLLAAIIGFVIFVAYLFYQFIEKPFLFYSKNFINTG